MKFLQKILQRQKDRKKLRYSIKHILNVVFNNITKFEYNTVTKEVEKYISNFNPNVERIILNTESLIISLNNCDTIIFKFNPYYFDMTKFSYDTLKKYVIIESYDEINFEFKIVDIDNIYEIIKEHQNAMFPEKLTCEYFDLFKNIDKEIYDKLLKEYHEFNNEHKSSGRRYFNKETKLFMGFYICN